MNPIFHKHLRYGKTKGNGIHPPPEVGGLLPKSDKQKLTQSDAAHAGQQSGANFIPGAAPVGERKGMDEDTDANDKNETTGQVSESANSSSNT